MPASKQPRPLVDYSDSDSDDAPPPPAKLRKTSITSTTSSSAASTANASYLPPLPSRFLELYAVPPRIAQDDDPALHGGRKRSIPHVHGNWPTHVFVECMCYPADG